MTNSLEGLPVEMQQRIADIIEQAKANPIQPVGPQAPAFHPVAQQVAPQQQAPAPPAPSTRTPSLMDHVISLRVEVDTLRQQVNASSQVTEAVGQAVGQLYQMFCQQTEVTDQGSTYASQFQQQDVSDDF